ncbi:MAG TPA: M56 family metallopeptidase [Allosphingosinicella sp.]|jgi:beta-lactamase regulating signal transducer with metallopeptidase domain
MSLAFMIEMAWKSALIAGVALGLVAVLRSRAAADRAAVLRVSVALLLLLPLFSLALPKLEIEAWAAEEIAAAPDLAAAATPYAAPEATGEAPFLAAAPAGPSIWDDPTILFLILYLGGVAMLGARLGAGLWTLGRWTKSARDVHCTAWTQAFERARWSAAAPQRLRLLVSDEAPSPMSWGLLSPVILIDRDTLDTPEDADAILAHEIAHVVRRDWLVLMLTRIAAALFWFNPLVWVLEREVVQQAEEAADIEAALWVEPARYAQTLVHWAQFNAGGLVPANSIAPSARALSRRVKAILDARRRATPSGSAWTLAAIAGCAVFAVTLGVLQLIPAVAEARTIAAAAPARPASPLAPPAPLAPPSAEAPLAPDAPPIVVNGVAISPAVPNAPLPPAAALAMTHPHSDAPMPPEPPHGARPWPTPPVPPRGRVHVAPPSPEAINRAVQAAVRATATARIDVDQLVAARMVGVNADYVRALAEANAALRRLPVEQLVAMRVHGVSPDFVREMAAAGYPNLSAESLVAMRIHGVSARDARRAAEVRGRRVSPDELVARAIQGGDWEE